MGLVRGLLHARHDPRDNVWAPLDVAQPTDTDLSVPPTDRPREDVVLDELVISLAKVRHPGVRLALVVGVLPVVERLQLRAQPMA